MALTYGFYNSVEGDRTYDAIQMGQIFDGIITDGVYATFLKAMVVKASDNPSEVIVQPGRCWFNHTWTYIDADYPVTAPAPEVILDRVDALVIDINTENAFRANSLVWVQGTPSSLNPERPTLIKSVTHNQYPLCYVYRKAGTTMIYAADITNAVGTSETPFVTGVLQGINIDDLLAQWDDEFHTWEATTKTSFEAWMVNQQSVYVTWFDSIKDQMEGDLTDFEAWFETIRGIIDEEAATHLQAEIDALSEMLPAGSHIDVSTSESTLFNRNVTVSDGVHSKTVQFDASGAATVESFPYIGIISVTSTDGTRTAEESINIPYFGRYSAVLAFWSATVNLVGDESLAALPVTVRDGNGDVVSVVTLNASGMGVFTATKPDTYKFIYTYGGQTMEVSLAVTQETTYEVEIHGGFNYQAWLTAGRVSESFSSLDDILEDEPTLRQLFLVHDSVDYICNTLTAGSLTDITKIFNTDLAAKWINLSDYALDHFYAVAGIKSIMDSADKYGYGEWALMPQVPNMTSNTAPYGTASASTEYNSSWAAWKAFDGVINNHNDAWSTAQYHTSNQYLRYAFPSPVSIKEVAVQSTMYPAKNCKIQYSIDGTTWNDIKEFTIVSNDIHKIELTTSITAQYWGLYIVDSVSSEYLYIQHLQFYAWAPKGNVPVMTSNTAPYGTVISSGVYSSSYPAWHVFDTVYTTCYVSNNSATGVYVGYKFVNPVKVKKYKSLGVSSYDAAGTITLKFQASNDNTNWTDLDEYTVNADYTPFERAISNDNYYLYYRILKTAMTTSSPNKMMYTKDLQFYGRELKASVPKMTSNTAPFGEAIYSTYVPDSGSGYAWNAFDNNNSTYWHNNINVAPDNISDSWIGYKFGIKMVPKMLVYSSRHHGGRSRMPSSIKLQGSDDYSTWTDIEAFTPTSAGSTLQYFSVTDDISYKAIRVVLVNGSDRNKDVQTLQFYGLDYSEKEFESGTTKKWLYDHGVELVEMEKVNSFSVGITKEANDILFNAVSSSTGNGATTSEAIDVTDYSLLRAKVGDLVGAGIYVGIHTNKSPTWWSPTATANYALGNADLPNKLALNISNTNGNNYPMVVQSYPSNGSKLAELWLE